MAEALAAVKRGFHIFPVEPGDKTPIRIYQERSKEDAPWTVRWSEIATNDVDKVISWWTYAPMANVGVACKLSSLLVVDCDVPKKDGLLKDTPYAQLHEIMGPSVDGETLYDAVAQRYGGVPAVAEAFDTYSVDTGSGGLHLYYRWPDDVQASQASIVNGVLDVRGNGGERGGYVLGEGSQTVSGGYVRRSGRPVREAPAWLVELCKDRPRHAPNNAPTSVFSRPRIPNFGGLVATVRSAPDGNLNNALFWASRAACQDGLNEEECADLLGPVYCELGGKGGDRQARQTIRSAYRNQGRKM